MTINQHYVPQSYLIRFSNERNQVFVFDKYLKKIYQTHVRNIASERFFYNLPDEGVLPNTELQVIEESLSSLERDFSLLIDGVIKDVEIAGCIHPNAKENLAYFTVLQLLRTKEEREFLNQIHEFYATWLTHMASPRFGDTPITPEEIRRKYTGQRSAWWQAKLLFDQIDDLTEVVQHHACTIGVNNTDQPLYTSDHPVVKKANAPAPYDNPGIGAVGIEIAFPLTPKYILMFTDIVMFPHMVAADCGAIALSQENIRYYNALQIHQSTQRLFSQSGEFELAKEVCEKHPQICDPQRPRFHLR